MFHHHEAEKLMTELFWDELILLHIYTDPVWIHQAVDVSSALSQFVVKKLKIYFLSVPILIRGLRLAFSF